MRLTADDNCKDIVNCFVFLIVYAQDVISRYIQRPSADLNMQIIQLMHCDGEKAITELPRKEKNFPVRNFSIEFYTSTDLDKQLMPIKHCDGE